MEVGERAETGGEEVGGRRTLRCQHLSAASLGPLQEHLRLMTMRERLGICKRSARPDSGTDRDSLEAPHPGPARGRRCPLWRAG